MPDIRQRVLIGASSEKVYAAITTQEGLSSWWTPDVTATPQRGSIARFGFKPPYFKEMRIIDLRPRERVSWTCIQGAEEWQGTNLIFQLEGGPEDLLLHGHPEMADQMFQQSRATAITLLTFRHENWKQETPMFAECSYTWGQFLKSLKSFCETGAGWPWPHQHRGEF